MHWNKKNKTNLHNPIFFIAIISVFFLIINIYLYLLNLSILKNIRFIKTILGACRSTPPNLA